LRSAWRLLKSWVLRIYGWWSHEWHWMSLSSCSVCPDSSTTHQDYDCNRQWWEFTSDEVTRDNERHWMISLFSIDLIQWHWMSLHAVCARTHRRLIKTHDCNTQWYVFLHHFHQSRRLWGFWTKPRNFSKVSLTSSWYSVCCIQCVWLSGQQQTSNTHCVKYLSVCVATHPVSTICQHTLFLINPRAGTRGGKLGSRPKKMYGERLGDGVEYHSMKPTPRR